MSSCNESEIAEKKRIAQERLRAWKAQKQTKVPSAVTLKSALTPAVSSPSISNVISPKSSNSFYSSTLAGPTISTSKNENKASDFLNALKKSSAIPHRTEARDCAHPYQRPTTNAGDKKKPLLALSPQKQLASVFVKSISCKVYVVSAVRFVVQPSGYHAKMIEVFKTIPSKSYDNNTRNWSFALNDYNLFQQRTIGLKPDVIVGVIPKNVINLCLAPVKELNRSCLASIEPTLAYKLMPFQEEGVCFAIAQQGRVMICDEMGLGKTYQALAVADFYKDNWPLLICTTASTREVWATHVRELLPYVPLHYIQVLNNTEYIGDAKVLITSYNMMERHLSKLMELKFGFLIFDESHTLKNSKAKCTNVAERLAMESKHVILLSGTPALSRPVELFTQMKMVDRKFMNYIDFTARYCDGKQTNFGWVATGQSNLEELNVVLKLKFMIRRTKAEVLPEMSVKTRETVVLDPALVWLNNDTTKKTLDCLNQSFIASKGKEREELLLKFYAQTAEVKTRAVCAYIKGLLKENIKFIVFAHHRVMLDAISNCLDKLNVDYVRIDGATKNDVRAELIKHYQKKSSCKIAVLSLKACNAGITLTAAEMIIFAELDWNPSTLAQAESRAHRIGQEKPVVCRYLMATKTADDVIWNMLKSKQDVLNKAGLFCENLQEATHTVAPTISKKIEEYFSPDKPKQLAISVSNESSADQRKTDKTLPNKALEHKLSNSTTKQTVQALQSKNCSSFSLTQELKNIDEIFKDDSDDVDFFQDAEDDDVFNDLKF